MVRVSGAACWLIGSLALGCSPRQLESGDGGRAAAGTDGGGITAIPNGGTDAGPMPARGHGGSPAVTCAVELSLTSNLTLAPAAPGQHYVRCATAATDAERWHVTVSPDGAHLAARTSVGTVRLFAVDRSGAQLPKGSEVVHLASPVGRLDAATFSPDGAHLAVLSNEAGEITLWRASDGALERTFAAPPGGTVDVTASALAFSPDGRRLATSLGTTIDLGTGASTAWDLGQSAIVRPVPAALVANPAVLSDGGSIAVLRFSADGGVLFVDERYGIGNSPWTARLTAHDQASGATRLLYEAYDRGLLGYALSPDGARLALATSGEGAPAGLQEIELATGAILGRDDSFSAHLLSYTADGGKLIARQETALEVLDARSLVVLRQFELPAGASFLALSPDGALIVTTTDATVWLDLESGATLRRAPFVLAEVAWSADGGFGAGVGSDGALVHLDRGGGSFNGCVAAGAKSDDGGADISGFTPLTVVGAAAPPFVTADGLTIRGAAVSPDGTVVAGEVTGANGGGAIGVWSLPDGVPRWTSSGSLYGAPPVFTADGGVLITLLWGIHTHATDHSAYAIWDAGTGALLRLFGADVHKATFSNPEGMRFATQEPSGYAVWCR